MKCTPLAFSTLIPSSSVNSKSGRAPGPAAAWARARRISHYALHQPHIPALLQPQRPTLKTFPKLCSGWATAGAMPKQPYSERSLFVENLPFRFTDEDLLKCFSDGASVKDARVYVQADGTSCGVGYVKFGLESDAALILERAKREGFTVDGRRLRLHPFTRELDEEYKRKRQAVVHREFRHPAQFEPRPDTVLLYNLPEQLATEEQVLEFGHKAYKSFTFAKLATAALKDWRGRSSSGKDGADGPEGDRAGGGRLPRYAVLHIAREKTKEGLSAADLSKVCADLFKRAKKEFGVTKESFVVRPYDIHAAPKATTLILRDLSFYVTYGDLKATFTKEIAPVLEYRIPGKSQGRSGAGFAFAVLADHADCARLVEKARVQVHGRDSVVDWSLAKDKFEEGQGDKGDRGGEDKGDVRARGDRADKGGASGPAGAGDSDSSESSDSGHSAGKNSEEESSDESGTRGAQSKTRGKTDGLPFEIESYRSSMLEESDAGGEPVRDQADDPIDNLMGDSSAGSDSSDSSDAEIREVPSPHPELATEQAAASAPGAAETKEAEFNCTIFITNLPARLPKNRMSDSEAAIRASEEAAGAEKGADIDPQRVLTAGLRYELRALFRPFGVVKSISVLTNRGTGRPTGSAFLRFAREGSATAVLEVSDWLRKAALSRAPEGQRGEPRGRAAPVLEVGEADIGEEARRAVAAARGATAGADARTSVVTPQQPSQPSSSSSSSAAGAQSVLTAPAAAPASPLAKYKLPESSYSIQEGAFMLNMSPLHITRAVPAGDLKLLKQHRQDFGSADAGEPGEEKPRDPRNLHLARVGLLLPGTPAFTETDVPQGDVQRRVKCWTRLKAALKDPNVHLNPNRLSILNIPDEVDELRIAMLIGKAVGRASEGVVRAELEATGISFSGPGAAQARCQLAMQLLRKNGVRDLRMGRQGQRAKNLVFGLWEVLSPRQAGEGSGAPALPPRHAGCAFVEFRTHEEALRCLLRLNNSGRAFTRERRPIVEFATTNLGEMRRRAEAPAGKGAGKRLWGRGAREGPSPQKPRGARQKK